MYIYSVDVKVDGIDETALVRKLNNKDIIINKNIKYVFPQIKDTHKNKKLQSSVPDQPDFLWIITGKGGI